MTQVNPASHEAYRLIAEDAIADDEYIRIGANALGICASGAADGIGTPPIAAPWPAVLEHAPTAELVRALVCRGAAVSCHRTENHKEIVEWVDMLNWPGHTDVVLVPLEPEL